MSSKLFNFFLFLLIFTSTNAQFNKIEHKVKTGESLNELAFVYQTEIDSLIIWNYLVSESLNANQTILIKDYNFLNPPQIEVNKVRYQLNVALTDKVNKETFFNLQIQELDNKKKTLDPNVSSSIYEAMNISKLKKYWQDSLTVLHANSNKDIDKLSLQLKDKEISLSAYKAPKGSPNALQTQDLDAIKNAKIVQASKDSALAYIEKQDKLALQAEQERILLEKVLQEKAEKEAAEKEKLAKEKAKQEAFLQKEKILDTPQAPIKVLTEEEALNAAILKAEQARLLAKNQNNTNTSSTSNDTQIPKIEETPTIIDKQIPTKENPSQEIQKPSIIKENVKTVEVGEILIKENKKNSKYAIGDEVEKIHQEKAKFLLERAKLEIDKKDFKKAMTYIDKSIVLNPSVAEAYQMKADIFAYFQYFDKALIEYENALILVPNAAQVHYNMGNCYIYLGKKEKAFEKMNKSIQYDSKYILAYSVRAGLHFENQNYQAALADYNTILSINAYFYPALRGRGMVFLNLDNYKAAIQDFIGFLSYDNKDASVYYHLGLAKMYDDNFYEACLDFLKAEQMGFEAANKAIQKYCE